MSRIFDLFSSSPNRSNRFFSSARIVGGCECDEKVGDYWILLMMCLAANKFENKYFDSRVSTFCAVHISTHFIKTVVETNRQAISKTILVSIFSLNLKIVSSKWIVRQHKSKISCKTFLEYNFLWSFFAF